MLSSNIATQALLLAVLAVALGGNDAWAQQITQPIDKLESRNAFAVQTDNDIFMGSDRDYSAGLEIAWTFAAQRDRETAHNLRTWMLGAQGMRVFGRRRYDLLGSRISLGTKMLTPGDLRATELVEDDRPYSGWTYAEFAFDGRTGNTVDTFALTAGIVGPVSQAGDFQRGIHKALGNLEPQGWDNQLDNEFGLVVEFEQNQRLFHSESIAGLELEVVNTRNLSLGNIDTSASAGLRLRAGQNIRSDFKRHPYNGDPELEPTKLPEEYEFLTEGRGPRLYLDLGFVGSFVARNLFLGGNTFEDSHSVDKRNSVGQLNAGLTWENHRIRIGLQYIYTTNEFEQQNGGHAFNSLTVTFR